MVEKKLPKHLQSIIRNAMKTNSGRKRLAILNKAEYYRDVSGKIRKVKK
jgi:hypothetical protein